MTLRPTLPPPLAPAAIGATTQHVPVYSLSGGGLPAPAAARPPTGTSLPMPAVPAPAAYPQAQVVHQASVPAYAPVAQQQVMPQPAPPAYPAANPWGAPVLQHSQLAYLPSPPPQPYAIVQYEGETLAERLAKNMLLRGAAAGCWELTQFLSIWPWAPSRK